METETTATTVRHMSLYCYALMLPFGYEPNLLAAQKQKKVGLFDCDAYTIFSNSTILLDKGAPMPIEVEFLDFSLAVPSGGKWHSALNTPVFNKIWTKVRDMGIYLRHDWVVKADPDTVWFPERLKIVLQRGIPEEVRPHQRMLMENRARRRLQRLPMSEGCKHCKLPGLELDLCDARVQWLQNNKSMSCDDALKTISKAPLVDCGCECSRLEACDLSSDDDFRLEGRFIQGTVETDTPAVYINNRHWGLHGPIEVLSSGAVTAYVEGLPRCEFLLAELGWEDAYLDRCMLVLGVTRVNIFGVLSEIACGEEPVPTCGGTDVAFHPSQELKEAEAEEDRQASESAEAAKIFDDSLNMVRSSQCHFLITLTCKHPHQLSRVLGFLGWEVSPSDRRASSTTPAARPTKRSGSSTCSRPASIQHRDGADLQGLGFMRPLVSMVVEKTARKVLDRSLAIVRVLIR